ncbi:MAG: hypothetical protein Q4F71_05435 [Paracoccus sp. (in: a-proteobacteria)]|nr:hypothetical protein [Paracoccus sp. (in: a-proteobacteria)]
MAQDFNSPEICNVIVLPMLVTVGIDISDMPVTAMAPSRAGPSPL